MSCERFREAITDHACGAPIDAATIAHLSACDACREVAEVVRRLLADVDGDLCEALKVTASPDFVARVSSRVRGQEPTPAPWTTMSGWGIAAAAAAVVFLALYVRLPNDKPFLVHSPTESPAAFVNLPVERHLSIDARSEKLRLPRQSPQRGQPAARRAKTPVAAGAREPEVIVGSDQIRAIARLRELLRTGALEENALPPPRSESAAVTEVVIPPLVVPAIVVPDVDLGTGTAVTGEASSRDRQ